ncbi:unnamed protein product [Adineta steineri]|uniref:BD-FAE-like domain-containing protein n=1 Tax=Adineta steineri TaxID=433720 RepID=A0A816B8U8_9BILA|nr:unnamed protein product [Adineta steineri]CAF1605812.1 unnamed protein product [Adineta steineri]
MLGVNCNLMKYSNTLNEKNILKMIDRFRLRSRYQKRSANANMEAKTSTSTPPPCYESDDESNLRLWNNSAPGAVGNDSCKDIPFLKVFMPNASAPQTDIGIIIIPGGGYDKLTDSNEQTPVAQYFANKLGITSFILYYRLVQKDGTYRYPVPMWDGQRALRYVRYNAAQFKINPDQIGLFGFSAGGHLASTIALHSNQNFNLTDQDDLDSTNARPNFLGLGYPVISMDPQQYASNASRKHLLFGYTGDELTSLENYLSGQKHVTKNIPPIFIFESVDDKQISSQNSVLFIKALEDAGISYEAHMFEQGKHGAGLAEDEQAESIWPTLFHNWLIERNYIS